MNVVEHFFECLGEGLRLDLHLLEKLALSRIEHVDFDALVQSLVVGAMWQFDV
jgi:hypothetical protein